MTASYKKQIGIVALIMAFLVTAAVVITILAGASRNKAKRLNIVASFIPVYSAALRVADGVNGASVASLTPAQTGCLHDYQLTPGNMITLSRADVLILNGAGAESFLNDVRSQYPDLKVIDTSEGIGLMESSGHHHEDEENEKEEEHEEELYNEHIWTGPSNYIRQVENLRDGLIKIDPDYAEQYRENASGYLSEIQSLKSQLLEAVSALPTRNCILFHDSLSYFARELGLTPVASFSIGEESVLSAADLAQAAAAAEKAGKVLLIYDNQYETEYAAVAENALYSRVLKLDTAVIDSAAAPADVWINAMKANLRMIKEIK